MSRTDDLRSSGAVARTKEVSGDDSMEPAAYIKWGDEYAWVEGQVKELWDSPKGYGESVSVILTSCSDDLEGKLGTEIVAINAGERVNVGLGSATLQGTITEADVQQGKYFHVAFMRWQEPANGNRYRVFTVLEVAPPEAEEQGIVALKVPVVESEDDDGLPF
jgi:hypothetical protein